MNQISEVLTTLIHYNVAVRDTLEYCLRKDSFDPRMYEEKKRSILVEVDQHTPLKDIIDHSGENGEKLEKAIRDFYAEVYGDDSTILKNADDGLRVDHAQHQAIYQHVLPIHEDVNNMILGVLADGHKNNLDVAEAEKVAIAEEALYRGVAYLTLVSDLNLLFNDFNKTMNENKGEPSPASNFIGQDIEATIRNINFVRSNAKVTNAIYKNMEDKIVALIENMTGRRDLPVGKRFPDVMRETVETINLYIRDAEAAFRACYGPLVQALLEQVKADDEARARGEAPQAAGSANDVEKKA